MILTPGLYVVSTPIGNLNDITIRALEVLRQSDIIFCENSRVSIKLLEKHNITANLKIYNDHSDYRQRQYIQQLINRGKIISLISDAGTPLISDPGYKLIQKLKENNIKIDVIPGPCALIAGLTISGLPTDQFMFIGFLPKTTEKKSKIFINLQNYQSTIIFYESPTRLIHSLEIAKSVLGNRIANVSRELTKIYQDSKYDLLSNLIRQYTTHPPKGEIIVYISGKTDKKVSIDLLHKELYTLISSGRTAKSASDEISTKYKKQYSRKEIYQLANQAKASKNL